MLGNGTFHGMYNPSAVWANDSRILFDGVNDFFDFNDQTDGTFHNIVGNNFVNAFSVSFWFQHNGAVGMGSQQTFFRIQIGSRGSDIVAKYIPTGSPGTGIYFTRADQGAPGTIDLTGFAGLSHSDFQASHSHYVLTMTKSEITMYKDGSGLAVTPGGSGGSDWESNDPLGYNMRFGATGVISLLNGYMNNIALYNRVLTGSEVTDIYNNGEPKNELRNPGGDPVIYYAANEKSFKSEIRHTTTSNHTATLEGPIIVPNV